MTAVKRLLTRIHRWNKFARISVVAATGVILSWVTYEIVYLINFLEPRASTSWFISFVLGVIRQHHLHRLISFPETETRYLTSLRRDFVSSIGLLFASSTLNWILTEPLDLHHRLAWAVCIVTVAGCTYILMKTYIFRS